MKIKLLIKSYSELGDYSDEYEGQDVEEAISYFSKNLGSSVCRETIRKGMYVETIAGEVRTLCSKCDNFKPEKYEYCWECFKRLPTTKRQGGGEGNPTPDPDLEAGGVSSSPLGRHTSPPQPLGGRKTKSTIL